jgi:hypothetical protein
MLGVIKLGVIMTNAIMLSVIMTNAIMLSVVAPFQIALDGRIVFTSGFGFFQ